MHNGDASKKPKDGWTMKLDLRPDLMPCAYCGGPPTHVAFDHPQWRRQHMITCNNENCYMTCGTVRMDTFEECVAIWQTRPQIVQLDVNNILAELDDEDFGLKQ